ncbi:tyrosine-type recombinase/integrase [Paenibacillus sacheonensis]|uniref:Tyrosine-type recombinase/integrase n=1 Tax=Paenibacillus sacheonensis TaxID=742054 RepID=A0A7X4YV67_9BACL|nr:site-specific integrase [Paenibacillus sacheonensis]MBM7565754.1 site-specific recombinase XerD [Paenibacillus sacheonensis]NBC72189.1 tyrosine-type recombinase/integrase [Paenibacillus sacheonensis]
MSRILKVNALSSINWTEALEQFLFWKKAQGISEQTQKDYNQQVRLFFKRYPDSFDSMERLKHNGLHYLGQDGIKPCTFNNRLVYLRTFFNWCLDQSLIEFNPILSIKKRKDEGRVVSISYDVLKQLLEQPDTRTFVGLRDYALILLTLDTGIRPKEALTLSPVDFNPNAQEIYITSEKAKTRVSRSLPISVPTVKAIRQLLSVRPVDWSEDVTIFCTYEGRKLNRHTWGDRLEKYSKSIGVMIRPYDLRHSFALEYIRNGANALTLQKTLGHSDLTMTKRYVALTNNDLKREHMTASPINKLMPETKRIRKL